MVTNILCAGVVLLTLAFIALFWSSVVRIGRLKTTLAETMTATRSVAEVADKLGAEARLQKRRADEFFGIIEGVEKERDQWQALYRRSSQGAGATQAWLIRELTSAVKRSNAYAKALREKGVRVDDLTLDPALTRAIEEYTQEHVAPPEVPQTAALATAQKVEKQLSEQSVGTG